MWMFSIIAPFGFFFTFIPDVNRITALLSFLKHLQWLYANSYPFSRRAKSANSYTFQAHFWRDKFRGWFTFSEQLIWLMGDHWFLAKAKKKCKKLPVNKCEICYYIGYLQLSAALYTFVFCMLHCIGCYITNHIFLIYKKIKWHYAQSLCIYTKEIRKKFFLLWIVLFIVFIVRKVTKKRILKFNLCLKLNKK